MPVDIHRLGEVFNLPTNGEMFEETLDRTSEEITVTIDTVRRAMAVGFREALMLYSDDAYAEYGDGFFWWTNVQQAQYLDDIHALFEQEKGFATMMTAMTSQQGQVLQEENPLLREYRRRVIKIRNQFEALKQCSRLKTIITSGVQGYDANRETDEKMQVVFDVAADFFRTLPAGKGLLAESRDKCANMADLLQNKHSALAGTSDRIAKSLRKSFDFFYPGTPQEKRP